MNNILFVGDLHLTPRIPLARKDDYPQTILNKLLSLKKLIPKYKIGHIVFLGDLFNTRHMTLAYFIKCFSVFQQLENAGVVLHLLVGNHDILFNNDSTLEESPIKLLLDSYLFETKTTFTVNDTTVSLFDFTIEVQDLPSAPNSKYTILAGHYFYKDGFNDTAHTLTDELCSKLGYKAYVLGHDHTPYSPINKQQYQIYRPGSFSRGTSQTCQVSRDEINVYIFDTTNYIWIEEKVPNVLPSKDVYKESHLIDKFTTSDISDSLQDFLASLDFNNSSDIFATLKSIPMSDDVRTLIISYLNSEGVFDDGGETT